MERIYKYSILLIVFILPGAFYGITLAVLAAVFICWLYKKDYKNIPKVIKQPQVLLPLAFYLLIASGVVYAHYPGKALSGLSTQLSFVLFPLIIGSSSLINKELVKEAGRIFTFSTCLFIFIAICNAFYSTISTGESTIMVGESLYSKFRSFGLTNVFKNWHPTYIALFANLSIAIQLQQCLEVRNKKNIIRLAIVLFLAISLFLLNSLIGMVSFVLIVLYFIFKFAGLLHINNWERTGILLMVCIGFISLFYFNPFQIEKIESLKNKEFTITDNQKERNLLTMRMAKWETHADIFKAHWLVGTSYGDINYIRKETYKDKGYQDLAHYNYNAHNQYLEVLATYGITGCLIFLGLLLLPVMRKNKHMILIPFLLIMTVTFLTESVLVRQQGILFFMFFYALYTHPLSTKKGL
jgi:O-antigen ligase